MNKIVFYAFIIVFLSKTGNVLSSEGIFTVNNIEVNTKNLRNNNGYLNQAFKKGFDRLIKRALLIEDYEKVKNLPISSIKKLISHYQILKDDKNLTTSTVIINIFFDIGFLVMYGCEEAKQEFFKVVAKRPL